MKRFFIWLSAVFSQPKNEPEKLIDPGVRAYPMRTRDDYVVGYFDSYSE